MVELIMRTKDAPTLEERFWLAVPDRPEDGCWEWQGTSTAKGYGQISHRRTVSIRAHRLSYEIHSGSPVPPDVLVCHHCDNRRCVRFDHLFLGSHADNQADKAAKGRSARGETHGAGGKLTEDQVRQIKAALAVGPRGTGKALAAQFGVTPAMISRINRGTGWAWLK